MDDNASPSLVGKLDNIQGMSVTVWTTMPAPHLLESLTTYWGCRSLLGDSECVGITGDHMLFHVTEDENLH